MRATEFIVEHRRGNIPGGAQHAMASTHLARDQGGYDRTNWLNRTAMAMAMHDGKSKKPIPRDKMDPASWVEKYNTLHAYTKEEENMIHGAMKTIGAESHHVISNHASTERSDTYKTSPVAAFRGYPR
jgi:hypothetical protein